ncbi:MAG TPA: 4Fe-4S dicluster domain-containing protein [Nitrospirae bacterium]|nr:4Fe-4S dicluster domain-containing protein [Nitrospirota bacterium]
MRYLKGVSTLKYDEARCTGCGRCMEVCPHAVFEHAQNGDRAKRVRVTDKDLCMECGACMQNCAFGAIEVDAGVGCAAAIINSLISGGEPSCDCSEGSSSSSCC